MNKQPDILVGILSEKEIEFEFYGIYSFNEKNLRATDRLKATYLNKEIILSNEGVEIAKGTDFLFTTDEDASFLLRDVTIGINFHWEQKEDQRFKGGLRLIIENEKVRAINIAPLEEYLRSVISSEMSATSSPDLLKAHAVISRSWLLAQIEKTKRLANQEVSYQSTIQTDDEIVRWYDREDHSNFDVCADDHCQRYQGITKIISDKALKAVNATSGEVLMADEQICDARFSKCCGGMSENFELVWEPIPHNYLTKVIDTDKKPERESDLRDEQAAEEWIRTSPVAFCNTTNQKILSQVLPDFDQATADFYRWKVTYSQNELSG